MKFNIAIVLEQSFDPESGGVQRVTSSLASLFRENGHHVIIVSIAETGKNKLQWNSLNIYYLGGFFAIKSELKSVLQLNNVNIVINQAGYSGLVTVGIKSALISGAKLINAIHINPLNFVNNHEVFINEYLKKKRIPYLNNRFVRQLILKYHYYKQKNDYLNNLSNVDALVLLSDSFKQEIFQLCPEAKSFAKKIVGIPNPFPIPDYNYSHHLKSNVILYVGRLEKNQKRVDILIKLWIKLHHILPEWDFWVVGHGPEENWMKEVCKNENLSRVRFFGKDNPNPYYEKAKILHLTSDYEGFGNVLVEAQRYGCVPILFDTYSAAKDIVHNEINGFIIPPCDEEQFISRTIQLSSDKKMLLRLALASLKNAERYSYDHIYAEWEKMFKNLMAQK